MSTIELTGKIREIRELQQFIEEATAEADALKDEVKCRSTIQIGQGIKKGREKRAQIGYS